MIRKAHKTRLEKPTETADLNKVGLMDPQTDSWETSIGPTQTPWTWVSVRRDL